MDEAKIKEVFSDEAFVKELLELETPAEVQAALKAKGIEISEAEILKLRDGLVDLAKKAGKGEELSLDQLDSAAGGAAATIGIGTVIAGAIAAGIAVGFVGGGIGLWTAVEKLSDSKRW